MLLPLNFPAWVVADFFFFLPCGLGDVGTNSMAGGVGRCAAGAPVTAAGCGTYRGVSRTGTNWLDSVGANLTPGSLSGLEQEVCSHWTSYRYQKEISVLQSLQNNLSRPF
jgi:hypothetical protein